MSCRIRFDGEKCTACGACAVACMDQNDIDIPAGQRPYRTVYRTEREGVSEYVSSACRHCADAPCVQVCPMGCLYKDVETGLVLYDNAKCVGCHACERACLYGAVSFRPTGLDRPRERMEKCHGCAERIRAGLLPACVRNCPTSALTME